VPPSKAYLSVCAVYRDEAPYLREWIEFHRLVGVERFFLYNHAGVDQHREALAPYVADGFVTIEDLPDDPNPQFGTYDRCLQDHRDEARWIAFIDIDEFLFSPSGRPLSELLVEYEAFPAVAANWAMYGTSGHRSRPPGLVIENYLWRGDSPDLSAARQFKCMVDPQRAVKCLSGGHWFEFTEGDTVDERKQPLAQPYSDEPRYSKFRINHYYTRSEEECIRKYARPRVNDSKLMGGGRPPLETLQLTLHDTRDDAALIYAAGVREALAKANERAPFDPDLSLPPTVRDPVPELPPEGSERDHDWGGSALGCIEVAIDSARRVLPRKAEKSGWTNRILVFPCGRGLVVRALRAAFPEAEITACDLDRQAVDFCAEAFGAVPLYADADPARIDTDATYDLIWCGSLFTHLDSDRWVPFLEFLEGRLRPWGILLFGTNGRFRATALGSGELELDGADEMRAEYARTGFSHRNGRQLSLGYDGEGQGLSGWGIAIASLAWTCSQVEERAGLRLIACAEQAWNRHLDVLACARVAPWLLVRDLVRMNPAITVDELVARSGYDDETVRLHLARQEDQGTPSPA
jgi:hypothetical protein